MIRGCDILVLSDDWHGLPNSTKHLFRHILPHNRVFWWNVISRPPRLRWRDARRAGEILRQALARDASHGAGRAFDDPAAAPDCATPLIVPWFKRPVRRLNRRIFEWYYRRLSREHAVRSPLVFTTLPPTVDFVADLEAAAKIYYCVDEWLDYPDLNSRDWGAMERKLLDLADGFVATSTDLLRKARPGQPMLYLPHGVDYDHFLPPPQGWEPVPMLERLPHPIVGFFGLVAEWIDLNAVAAMSRAFPDHSFVLLGKAVVSMTALQGCANVHHLGQVSYAELPRFARYFDVGLIPFERSKLTSAVNPLKLLEYYALGTPVVATRLPELQRADGPIWLASNEAEYCQALDAALRGRETARDAACQVAARNTWKRRAEELSGFLESLL